MLDARKRRDLKDKVVKGDKTPIALNYIIIENKNKINYWRAYENRFNKQISTTEISCSKECRNRCKTLGMNSSENKINKNDYLAIVLILWKVLLFNTNKSKFNKLLDTLKE